MRPGDQTEENNHREHEEDRAPKHNTENRILEPFLFAIANPQISSPRDCEPIRTASTVASRWDVHPGSESLLEQSEFTNYLPDNLSKLERAQLAVFWSARRLEQLQAFLESQFPSTRRPALTIKENLDEDGRINSFSLQVHHLEQSVCPQLRHCWGQVCQALRDVSALPATSFKSLMTGLKSLADQPASLGNDRIVQILDLLGLSYQARFWHDHMRRAEPWACHCVDSTIQESTTPRDAR